MNRAIVAIPFDYVGRVLKDGMTFPDGYNIVVGRVYISPDQQSLKVLVESPDIPETRPGHVYPNLITSVSNSGRFQVEAYNGSQGI